jgi:hypothetical protein
MRFILTTADSADLSFDNFEAVLQAVHPGLALVSRQPAPYAATELLYDGEVYAELEINHKRYVTDPATDDDLFADAITILRENLDEYVLEDETDREIQAAIRATLDEAQSLIIATILFGMNGLEDGIRLVDPLWDWLFDQYDGLLYVDLDGYYDGDGLLLELTDGG